MSDYMTEDEQEVIDDTESPSAMNRIYIVIGIVLFVLVLIIVLAIYCFWRSRKKSQGRDEVDNPGGTMRLSLLGQQYQDEPKNPSIEVHDENRLKVQADNDDPGPKAAGGARGSFYMFQDETSPNRRSSWNSQDLSMSDVENQVKVTFEEAPLASSETLKSTRPNSVIQTHSPSFLNKTRPQSEGPMNEDFPNLHKPKLPPKKASMKKSQYKSTGVLLPASGVSRRIAMNKALAKKNMSNSESDLHSKKRRKKKNPFADSDDSGQSSSDSDFVDISDLPPLPSKIAPPLFPKQKINKSKSTLRRIDQAMLAKYRSKSKESVATLEDLDDYEDVPTAPIPNSDAMDYDEPIPHSTKVKQYINM